MSNLDDFFAKKDKKKAKKKGFSKANTDVLAKNLEEQDRREAKAEEKTASVLATTEVNRAQAATENTEKGIPLQTDDEWKDYDDDKKDYSNLKIEALKVDDEEEVEEEEEHEINEEGEKVRIKKSDGGPWNNKGGENSDSEALQEVDNSAARQRAVEAAELESSIGAPKGSVVGGSYVPPHMRNATAGGGGSGSAPYRSHRKAKHVPDMTSEIYFPSLSAATGPNDPKAVHNERDFEEVKSGGGQHMSSRSTDAPRLALDNKYAALRN